MNTSIVNPCPSLRATRSNTAAPSRPLLGRDGAAALVMTLILAILLFV